MPFLRGGVSYLFEKIMVICWKIVIEDSMRVVYVLSSFGSLFGMCLVICIKRVFAKFMPNLRHTRRN